MSCIFWNCQGLGAPLTIHVLGDILRDCRPLLVFLSETKGTRPLLEKLKRRWNLNGFGIDKVGNSGGLILFWQKEVEVDLISYSNNHIDAEVLDKNHNSKWRVTGFYGFPEISRRHESWAILRQLRNHRNLPWVVGGDYNEILSNNEKEGGLSRLPAQIEAFREALDDCGLTDLEFEGPRFTWSNNRDHPYTVRCRLDRVCASADWLLKFPRALVHHMAYSGSDHVPLQLVLDPAQADSERRKKRPFRFEAIWLRRDDCEEIVQQNWQNQGISDPIEDVVQKKKGLRLALIHWNKATVQAPRKRINQLNWRIHYLRGITQSEITKEQIRVLKLELERAYEDNNLYWRQRSKIQWIQEGDRNTKFFHAKATSRHRINRMERLKGADGEWKESHHEIEQIISDYFNQLFTSTEPNEDEIEEVLTNVENKISSAAGHLLSMPFTAEEFGSVRPTRGLRQGDPLSPYLFICCAEALTAMITRATERGDFHGVQVAPSAPTISSLCFADDTFIFGKATEECATTLRTILTKYARVSGQEINIDKSTMCFCPATPLDRREAIQQILQFRVVDGHDRYMGMPALIGRTKKKIFSYLRDRVWTRVKGWGEKQLSQAGKEVLIKSVLQAIPAYIMSCFFLPNGLISEIERVIRRFWWGKGDSKGMAWVSWKDLCKSKEQGGLGFRDLRAFNTAMIMKQAWRILVFPDLLMSRIMAARYFPHGNLLMAGAGYRPSTTWRCIWKTIPYLQAGLRRRIGNGANTSIWADPWLRDGGNFKIITVRPISSAFPDRVSDLLESDSNSWNLQLVHNIFWEVDVDRILGVPLGGPHTNDSWVWHHSPKGNFTVRSAYHMILNNHNLSSPMGIGNNGSISGTNNREWKCIWRLPIPPKIQIFLWRFCGNNLPTNEELHRRRIITSPACRRCGASNESTLHVIATCKGMNKVWENSPFGINPSAAFSSPWQWWLHMKHSLDENIFLWAMVIAWKAWESRNREIHNEEVIGADELPSWCSHYLVNFKSNQIRPNPSLQLIHPTEWKPPEMGVLKINFDVAIRRGEPKLAVAAVARNHERICVGWKVVLIDGNLNPVEGEAMAALHAIMLASMNGWNEVIFEGDSLQVIQALRAGGGDMLPFGAIIDECIYLANVFTSFSFSFVKRSGNSLAHALAHLQCIETLEGFTLPYDLANMA
ncbi:PREDICTED: uncharacterized protein LOC105976270 [Erythranthe guttata]|uniref:uncharacterized protein LOC105976270 n=1 Tax=Erythranthe guttata TaxID=4155 RepID=UPI00064D7E2D|nr:PREDICTED: uncharacterized protein LOC105976270 [Erythranthe guttata]|eukprot:XP_012857002.1 PREDICTED: uncharacterized protein LOC105976270 [Erythranthe guttata]